jgi:hypothetical protein
MASSNVPRKAWLAIATRIADYSPRNLVSLHAIAREHFRTALALARNPMERHFLERRAGACEC